MISPLIHKLAAVHRRRCTLERRRRAMSAFTLWLGLLLVLSGIDAAWSLGGWKLAPEPAVVYELPTWWRLAGAAALAAVLIGAAIRARLASSMRRFDPTREALRCERAMNIHGNLLVNAVQLRQRSARASGRTPLALGLARRAIAAGDAHADQIAAEAIVDAGSTRQATLRLLIVGIVASLAFALTPLLGGRTGLTIATMRYLDPFSDRPPAAWVDLHIAIDPSPVVANEPMRVAVHAAGPTIPTRAQLTIHDRAVASTREADFHASGTAQPRDGQADTRHAIARHALPAAREPFMIEARAGGARTRRMHIDPATRPRLIDARLTVAQGDRRVRLRWPPAEPIRALAGATLTLDIDAMPDPARLDHAAAEGQRLSMMIRPGRHAVEAHLISPRGVRSHQAVRLTIEGLSETELADLQRSAPTTAAGDDVPADAIGLVAADALPSAIAMADPGVGAMTDLDGGRPATGDVPDRGDESRSSDGVPDSNGETTTGEQGNADNGTVNDAGEGDGTAGGYGGDPRALPGFDPREAIGVVLESMAATDAERRRVTRQADRAPPQYRADVAGYFLRIMRDERSADPGG